MKEKANDEHHVVTIWELDNTPQYELLFRFAYGFVHAALAILKEQRENNHRDYFNLMPAHFALEHGLELFLKGAILLGDTSVTLEKLSSKKFGHSLEELHNKYRKVYPGDEFEIYHRINELINWRATINDPRGFSVRYPFDNKGAMYGARNRMIDVEFEIEICYEFHDDLIRLEQEIKKAKGVQSYPIEQFKYKSTR